MVSPVNAKPFLLLAVATAVVAGCVKGPADDGPARPQDIDLDPNSGFGLVRGTVLADDGLPVAGAQLMLEESGATTDADATGAFAFVDVEPGAYTLHAAALGHMADARPIEVRAGEATDVTVSLVPVAAPGHAHVEILQHVGFFECALATEVWISSCSYPYTALHGAAAAEGVNLTQSAGMPSDIQRNIHRFNITINPGIETFVGELTWQAGSAASNRMLMLVLCGDYDPVLDECYDGIRYEEGNGWEGPSPVQVRINGSVFYEEGNGTEKWDLNKGPIWVMNYIGLPWGDPQLAFQQRFEVWDSVFYNAPAPAGYTTLATEG